MDGLISEYYVIQSYIFIFAFRYSSFVHSFLLILTSPCVCSLPFRLLTTPILHSCERRPERDVTTQMERLCRRLKSSVHGSRQIFEQRKTWTDPGIPISFTGASLWKGRLCWLVCNPAICKRTLYTVRCKRVAQVKRIRPFEPCKRCSIVGGSSRPLSGTL